MTLLSGVSRLGLLAATPLFLIQAASAASDPIALPTGQMITPTAARGSVFQALILTSPRRRTIQSARP